MITLLSPSKGQDFSATGKDGWGTQPRHLDQSVVLIAALRQLNQQQIQQLMSVSEKIAVLNHQRFLAFNTPFTPENAKPAMLAFQGDVYQGLAASSLSQDELDFAQRHCRILSGLYGCLRPLDLIQPYRLEMKTRLANVRGKNLYQFWAGRITDAINADLQRHENPVVLNLASAEYFKAVQPKQLAGRLLQVEFKQVKEGQARVIGLFAKRARGMMANYIIRHRIDQPEALKSFSEQGYQFNPDDSKPDRWVFQRPQA